MNKLEKYKNFWERDKFRYVLLSLEGQDIKSIYNWYFHSIVMLDVDIETANEITYNMIDAVVEVFKSFDDLYAKYPPISSEERRKRMDEFPSPNLN